MGRHTQSFARALRGALREDPDVIMVGEMRDVETIRMSLMAAETGHLVIATLHTTSCRRHGRPADRELSARRAAAGAHGPLGEPQVRRVAVARAARRRQGARRRLRGAQGHHERRHPHPRRTRPSSSRA
ncbi:ATPase, T2SS/T4P/T4SS family [Nostocoides sp.]